jgi:predicted GNAT superfamily acetyltransferase
MAIIIKETSIKEVHSVSLNIPEFINPHPIEIYKKRLKNTNHLTLGAFDGVIPIGFKVGYGLNEDTFYSWMGAVLTDYRRQNIAKQLAQAQEKWAKENGYNKIRFKTRNKLRSMILFAIKNDFNIIEVETKEEIGENRIIMEKIL